VRMAVLYLLANRPRAEAEVPPVVEVMTAQAVRPRRRA
jgi:hypothetical protein